LAKWSRGIRGMFSTPATDGEQDEVINPATPPTTPNFFSTASKAFTTLRTQFPRFSEDLSLIHSLAKTKFLAGGVVDDKNDEVSVTQTWTCGIL
jgi:hypothetical protein